MKVLESRETPGLGDKIEKDARRLRREVRRPRGEPPRVLVKGRHKPNEVDAITGATISSRAVINILNNAMQRLDVLPASQAPGPAPASPRPETTVAARMTRPRRKARLSPRDRP